MRVPDAIVRHVSEPLWDLYENSLRLKTLRQLQTSQWWDLPRLIEMQSKRLNAICRHAAATSSFYRDRFAAAGIDPSSVHSINDLQGLPLLTKADVRTHADSILSNIFTRNELVPAKTGGSTGVALKVYCDRHGVEMRNAAALRGDTWSGWRLGEPMAAIWGNPPVPKTLKNKIRTTWKDRIIYLDTMKINDETIDTFLQEWRAMRPGMLYGHAHSIFILAEKLLERDIALYPTGIVATSMMLIDSERAVIEKAFGKKVTNRYGCEEVSLISCECEVHQGMHLNSEQNIVEFLRDDGTPCTPGEFGRIVVTELINHGMPMLRYEVGDMGVPSDRKCSCGRGLPLMESVSGRMADFLVAEDGSRVAGISIIENSLTKFSGIRQLQIIQERPCHLDVRLVQGSEYTEQTAQDLNQALKQMLGASFVVEIQFVDAIKQEENGKYRFTICRVQKGPKPTGEV